MGYKNADKQRDYAKNWLAERRARWLNDNGPCQKCGSTDRLEVDHVDPEQKISHNVWSWSVERREEELKKCQVLCNSCHKEKSREEQRTAKHGSAGMYAAPNRCRCPLCRAWNNARRARQRVKST